VDLKTFFDSEIVPCIRADGGWLELEREEGDSAVLTARGECTRCPVLERCLRWAESRVQQELQRDIRFSAVPDPYLWRK
jgi:Fe-S cluster biogenesis protein NfuA